MRGRLALAAMLVGSVTFLVSLYFDWLNAAFCYSLNGCAPSHDANMSGWTGYGQVAAVLAIALAAGAIAASVRKELATRLPVGRLALAFGMFAVLSVSGLWASAIVDTAWTHDTKIGFGAGAYIGPLGVGLACAGAIVARWDEITLPRRVTGTVGTLITLTLIASFVLPALNAEAEATNGPTGLGVFICVFACLGLLAWHEERPGLQLATATAIGTLVAAQLLPLRHDSESWPYELWLLLGCSAALLALSLVGSSSLRSRRPNARELAIVAGSVLLLVSLFLPWRSFSGGGASFTERGWSVAQLAGVFALSLVLALLWAGRFVHELAIGAAVFVLFAGLTPAIPHDWGLRPGESPPTLRLDYGALLGFAGAALLVIVCLGRSRPRLDKRFFVRLAPMPAALALLSIESTPNLLTLGDIVYHSNVFAIQSPFMLSLGLLSAMAILLTLRILLRWFDRPRDYADVVGLPLALLALTALAVSHDAIVTATIPTLGFTYGKGVSWEGWVAVFLCLLLVACGWIARRGAYPLARTDGNASTTSLATSP